MNDIQQASERRTTPHIYVASLADYSAGRLLGRWIDASQPAEEIHRDIAELLAESQEPIAEEWAIHDYDNFGPLRLSEWGHIETIVEVVEMMTVHGDVFAHLLNHFGGFAHLEDAKVQMIEGYCGAYGDLAEYAAESCQDCFSSELEALPGFLRYHIDWEGVANDLELSGDVFTVECDGLVHVFGCQI